MHRVRFCPQIDYGYLKSIVIYSCIDLVDKPDSYHSSDYCDSSVHKDTPLFHNCCSNYCVSSRVWARTMPIDPGPRTKACPSTLEGVGTCSRASGLGTSARMNEDETHGLISCLVLVVKNYIVKKLFFPLAGSAERMSFLEAKLV